MAILAPLQPSIDRGLLLAMLQQDALVEATSALGAHRWGVDMTTGTLTFVSEQDPNRQVATRAHLIASIAPGPRSVMWGWNHPQGSSDGAAAELRRRGEEDGVDVLTTGEIAIPTDAAVDDDGIATLAHEIGQAATGILGHGPYYSAPVAGGTRVVFLLDAPIPRLTLATAVIKLPRMLSTGLFRDARTSLWGLATSQGWDFRWTDDAFHGARISDGTSSAEFAFNDLAQITNVRASATA